MRENTESQRQPSAIQANGQYIYRWLKRRRCNDEGASATRQGQGAQRRSRRTRRKPEPAAARLPQGRRGAEERDVGGGGATAGRVGTF